MALTAIEVSEDETIYVDLTEDKVLGMLQSLAPGGFGMESVTVVQVKLRDYGVINFYGKSLNQVKDIFGLL